MNINHCQIRISIHMLQPALQRQSEHCTMSGSALSAFEYSSIYIFHWSWFQAKTFASSVLEVETLVMR